MTTNEPITLCDLIMEWSFMIEWFSVAVKSTVRIEWVGHEGPSPIVELKQPERGSLNVHGVWDDIKEEVGVRM